MSYHIDQIISDEIARKREYHEIITDAEREYHAIASESSTRKAALHAQASGKSQYSSELKELLNWLRYGQRPFTVSDENWLLFKRLAEHLVAIENFKPSALAAWA